MITSDFSNQMHTLVSPRHLEDNERSLISQLLARTFEGRDEMVSQLSDARIVAEGLSDTRTLVFDVPSTTVACTYKTSSTCGGSYQG